MRRHAYAITIIWALLAAVNGAHAEDRALIVGINTYPGLLVDGESGQNNLTGPLIDVRNMRQLLVDVLGYPSENVKMLTESEATRAGILDAIRTWLIDGTRPGDRIFFYFSGHGAQVAVPDGKGGKRLTSGLVPHDARSDISATATRAGGLVLGTQLAVLIEKMAGRQVTIVADSCFSGSVSRGAAAAEPPTGIRTITPNRPLDLAESEITDELRRDSKTTVRLLDFNARGGPPSPGVAVWSAATIAQFSWDTAKGGVFTNAFVAGLRGREADIAGTGKITASNLLAYVRMRSDQFCRSAESCTQGFTPELLASDAYRASVLVPFESAPGETSVPPSGPALVELAEGVLAHHNDFHVEAAILPSGRISVGDRVQFRIDSAEAGKLLVLDTGPDGKLRRIFPNDFSVAAGQGGLIRGGKPLTIPDEAYPFEFTATDAGPGTLLVLVAEPGTEFGQLLADSPAFEAVEAPDKALVAVAAELQEPLLSPDPNLDNRARRWAFVSIPYQIDP